MRSQSFAKPKDVHVASLKQDNLRRNANMDTYRQTLISDLILHGMPADLLQEAIAGIDTEELEHLLALMIESHLIKNNVEIG